MKRVAGDVDPYRFKLKFETHRVFAPRTAKSQFIVQILIYRSLCGSEAGHGAHFCGSLRHQQQTVKTVNL